MPSLSSACLGLSTKTPAIVLFYFVFVQNALKFPPFNLCMEREAASLPNFLLNPTFSSTGKQGPSLCLSGLLRQLIYYWWMTQTYLLQLCFHSMQTFIYHKYPMWSLQRITGRFPQHRDNGNWFTFMASLSSSSKLSGASQSQPPGWGAELVPDE